MNKLKKKVTMTRNEIERRVNEWVFDNYDYETDSLQVNVPLINRVMACLIKEPGFNFECMIYDDDINGDKELYLPNLCTFIEATANRSVCDCIKQYEF